MKGNSSELWSHYEQKAGKGCSGVHCETFCVKSLLCISSFVLEVCRVLLVAFDNPFDGSFWFGIFGWVNGAKIGKTVYRIWYFAHLLFWIVKCQKSR